MNELDNMPIKKIKFPCTHKGASKLTGEKLSKELSNIGLLKNVRYTLKK